MTRSGFQPKSLQTNITAHDLNLTGEIADSDNVQGSPYAGPRSGIRIGPYDGEQPFAIEESLSGDPAPNRSGYTREQDSLRA
jgi:hypothetical protein